MPRVRCFRWLPIVVTLTACGAAQVSEKLSPPPREASDTDRYVLSLREAALARLQVRAGQDAVAAEHFRLAYGLHPASEHLVGYAQAAERAGWTGEALAALHRLLAHDLASDQRTVVEAQVKRLTSLVPSTWQRVLVQVAPEGARVELRGEQGTRLLLSSGPVWLAPGSWQLEATAKGHASELRTLTVGPGEADVARVALPLDDSAPAAQAKAEAPPLEPEPAAKPEVAAKPDAAQPAESAATAAVVPPALPPERAAPASLPPASEGASTAAEPAPKAPAAAASAPPAPGPPAATKVEPAAAPAVATGPGVEPRAAVDATAAVEAPAPGKPWLHQVGPWTTLGLGGAALAAGGWFSWQMAAAAQEANDALPASGNAKTWYATQQDAIERAGSNARRAQSALVAGGVLTTAGIVWAVLAPRWLRREAADAGRTQIQPWIGPGGAAVAWTF